jgi:hypothetical protein
MLQNKPPFIIFLGIAFEGFHGKPKRGKYFSGFAGNIGILKVARFF